MSRLALVLTVLLGAACGDPPAQRVTAPASNDQRVRALADAYLEGYFERYPDQATYYGVRGLRQDDSRLLHEHAARLGELHLALGAVEKRNPEFLFELPDLMAEGRLTEIEPLGGAAEVQRLGQSNDVAKVAQLHPVIHSTS